MRRLFSALFRQMIINLQQFLDSFFLLQPYQNFLLCAIKQKVLNQSVIALPEHTSKNRPDFRTLIMRLHCQNATQIRIRMTIRYHHFPEWTCHWNSFVNVLRQNLNDLGKEYGHYFFIGILGFFHSGTTLHTVSDEDKSFIFFDDAVSHIQQKLNGLSSCIAVVLPLGLGKF